MASAKPVIARVADQSEASLKSAADSGVAGVMVPHVSSAEDAQNIVQNLQYPPSGRRGLGLTRSNRLGLEIADDLSNQSRWPSVIAQIEDQEAVRNVKDILSVPGISNVFVGPFDLSGDIGSPGNFENNVFVDAVEKVATEASNSGKLAGVFVSNNETLRKRCTKVTRKPFYNFRAPPLTILMRNHKLT